MSHICSRRVVASGELVVVEQCCCGVVHITIGAVTVRAPAGVVAPIADTLREAAIALRRAGHGERAGRSPEVLS